MTLTMVLWAGQHLAELLHHEGDRITGYTGDRLNTCPAPESAQSR
ncbi:hypothetical protein [Streptomyces sp. CBMA156]|nr:hypothetical protein [Streptomyces sp. CBMA156]